MDLLQDVFIFLLELLTYIVLVIISTYEICFDPSVTVFG